MHSTKIEQTSLLDGLGHAPATLKQRAMGSRRRATGIKRVPSALGHAGHGGGVGSKGVESGIQAEDVVPHLGPALWLTQLEQGACLDLTHPLP